MALDTGKFDLQLLEGGKESDVAVVAPDLNFGSDLGAALRAVRQAKGRSLQDIADQTRVRVVYLQALEEMRLADLPARPFALGYVRAYAQVLGLDPDQAIARFKQVLPELEDELGDPIGVRRERDPRVMIIAICGLVILLAIAGWSISQRMLTRPAETAGLIPDAPPAPSAPIDTAIALGAPTAPPTEANAPQPYITPGLGADPAAPAAAPVVAAPLANLGAPFQAKGKVYGAPGSNVILQATRSGQTLIVRRGDGSTAFAQVMLAGEAYGSTNEPGLTAEVSDATAFQVYAGGVLHGLMPANTAAFSRLVPPPPAAPKVAASATQPRAAPRPAIKPATPAAQTAVSPSLY